MAIKTLFYYFSLISDYYAFIVALIISILFFKFLCNYSKKINHITLKQLAFFKNNQKYLEKVFVEYDDTKEILRYFIYGKKWKIKLVSFFNLLFDNPEGYILQHNITDKKIIFHFNIFQTYFLPVKSIIEKIHKSFCILDDEKLNKDLFLEKDDNTYEKFWGAGYSYNRYFEKLKNYIAAIESKCILIKGTAGNGKTNLLCNIVQLLINLKNPCLFINSRDINKEVKQYVYELLPINIFLRDKVSFDAILFILNIVLKFQRKNLFIVIDAINENDTENFSNSFNDFINFIKNYSHVKLILSCRSEYFKERFNTLFKGKQDDFIFIHEIKKYYFPDRIKKRLFDSYKTEFNFNGEITNDVFSDLINSLLLMRIFFEVHKDSTENIVSLTKYKIYEKYIKQLKNNTNNPELLINKLVTKMIQKNKFSEISISELEISENEFSTFKKIADENILISRTIKKYENTLPETEEEVFYFVFDELRDYCISKLVIKKCLDNGDNEFKSLYNLIEKLAEQNASPLEGVLSFSYKYFKEKKNNDNCSKILFALNTECTIGRYSIQMGINEEKRYNFDNLGLNLIFEDNEELMSCELAYIKDVILNNNGYSLILLANFLLDCDLKKGIYSIEILNQILLNINDINILQHKFQPYITSIKFQESLLNRIPKLPEARKIYFIKYLGIIAFSHEKETFKIIENEIVKYNDVIINIIQECKCSKIKENAESFLQAHMRDIT
ncbi:MAG: hypothetical protein KIC80_06815 [Brachyspira sp.]|nr:hypothetical protein [Brachyspira sp.]